MDVSSCLYFQNIIYLGKTRIQLCHNEMQYLVQLIHTSEEKKAACDSSSWETEAKGSNYEFKASLCYIVSSGQSGLCLKKPNQIQTKNYHCWVCAFLSGL